MTNRSVTLRLPRDTIGCTSFTSVDIELKEERPTVGFNGISWCNFIAF